MSYLDERRNYIQQGRPLKTKDKKPIAPKSAKRIQKEKEEKERLGGNDSDLVRFFKSAIKRMKGVCEETGLKTETKIYAYAIMSVCHILPKATCKSVAYHPCNWVELNCDFHFKFDAMSWAEREKLGCWPVIMEKLIMVYPDLDPSERRHFPESVLNYMTKNQPF